MSETAAVVSRRVRCTARPKQGKRGLQRAGPSLRGHSEVEVSLERGGRRDSARNARSALRANATFMHHASPLGAGQQACRWSFFAAVVCCRCKDVGPMGVRDLLHLRTGASDAEIVDVGGDALYETGGV